MDGTPQSYDGIFRVLDSSAQVSDIIINCTKTKFVWIDNKTFPMDLFYQSRWKLSWDNLTFEQLCIKFSVTLKEMENYNYFKKRSKIRKLLNH